MPALPRERRRKVSPVQNFVLRGSPLLSKVLGRLSYSNVVATIALFIALGGATYAAVHLPKNSVGSKQIKKKAVKTSDLAADAVTSPKVANGSLLGEDFAAGQLPKEASCPSGTTRLGTTALCYDTTLQTANDPLSAAVACADRDLTLPTLSEAISISRAATTHDFLWSDILYYDGSNSVGVTGQSSGPGSYGSDAAATFSTYRCVTFASDG
jgi:hypothetical protein